MPLSRPTPDDRLPVQFFTGSDKPLLFHVAVKELLRPEGHAVHEVTLQSVDFRYPAQLITLHVVHAILFFTV
jgi:hypothetical protein